MSVQDNVAVLDGTETVSVSKNAVSMNASVQDFATYTDAVVQFMTAASGNYTVPAGKRQLRGFMTGAGGGGAGAANANASAGGGTSGVFVEFVMAVTPGQVIPFTCGALGAGGAAGNNNGTAGGDTTFGPFTAKGGLGATGSASGNAASSSQTLQAPLLAGSKVPPTTTQFIAAIAHQGAVSGAAGLGGWQGNGVGSPWGTPGAQVGPNAAGVSGTGYGAMGSSATSTTGGAFAGGDGTPGAIMIVAR